MTFAAKDILDVAGQTTGIANLDWKETIGPATETAWAIRALLEDGVTLVGETITEELALGFFGDNKEYSVSINLVRRPRYREGPPADLPQPWLQGWLDFALGSDSGGSLRDPASFCGL